MIRMNLKQIFPHLNFQIGIHPGPHLCYKFVRSTAHPDKPCQTPDLQKLWGNLWCIFKLLRLWKCVTHQLVMANTHTTFLDNFSCLSQIVHCTIIALLLHACSLLFFTPWSIINILKHLILDPWMNECIYKPDPLSSTVMNIFRKIRCRERKGECSNLLPTFDWDS